MLKTQIPEAQVSYNARFLQLYSMCQKEIESKGYILLWDIPVSVPALVSYALLCLQDAVNALYFNLYIIQSDKERTCNS